MLKYEEKHVIILLNRSKSMTGGIGLKNALRWTFWIAALLAVAAVVWFFYYDYYFYAFGLMSVFLTALMVLATAVQLKNNVNHFKDVRRAREVTDQRSIEEYTR